MIHLQSITIFHLVTLSLAFLMVGMGRLYLRLPMRHNERMYMLDMHLKVVIGLLAFTTGMLIANIADLLTRGQY